MSNIGIQRISRSLAFRAKALYNKISKTEEPPAQTYHEIHVRQACQLLGSVKGRDILVVGASHGRDCRLFIERGARSVVGLDVINDIGSEYTHPSVTYHQAPIEQSRLQSNSFDLVFATATMEHVPGIEKGFSEMVRLAKSGGAIFSLASPLWNSPYGHHMGCFPERPWIHLTMTKQEILEYAASINLQTDRGRPIERVVEYMLNPAFFNMRSASDYLKAVDVLKGHFHFCENVCHMETNRTLFETPTGKMALAKFSESELMSVTHQLSAIKS